MTDRNSLRKSRLIEFPNAAAGHKGVLSDPAGTMVIKPCTQTETDFYESIALHPELLPFLPTYIGRLSLGNDHANVAGALIIPGDTSHEDPSNEHTAAVPEVTHAWKPTGGGKIETEQAIVLQNVAAGYRKPNILDVKLGARLWDDDSHPEKRAKLDKVAEQTTSKPLGFRIAGMKTFQADAEAGSDEVSPDGYRVFDKYYGRNLTVDTVLHGFEDFFQTGPDTRPKAPIRKVIRRFIQDLQDLVEVLQRQETRMYSASLLFVYEGDLAVLRESFAQEADGLAAYEARQRPATPLEENCPTDAASAEAGENTVDGTSSDDERPDLPQIQSLKLIDFAHAQWTTGQGPDENLLYGVRNVIGVLSDLLR